MSDVLPGRSIVFEYYINSHPSKAIIWSEEPCTGESAQIPANNKCTPVPASLYVETSSGGGERQTTHRSTGLAKWLPLQSQKMSCVTSSSELSQTRLIWNICTDLLARRDENCQDPILYSVEDPGICNFSEWDTEENKVSNIAATIQCYDSTD